MKVSYVNIFPYRGLPEDFADRYESSWVTIPSDLYDREKGHEYYNDYLTQYELAIDGGFDAVSFNEHHSNAFGMNNSPNLIAAALARKVRTTEKTCLVLLGNSIALYNPVIRVAEELAILDTISGGRIVAGFPAGTSMDTNYVYGVPPAELRPRFYEALELIQKAWTFKEPFDFNGKFTQLTDVNIWPRPYQDPHPPIILPGSGSIETWDYCIRNDLPYYYLSYGGAKSAVNFTRLYWEHRQKLGKDDNPYWLGFNQLILVSETDEQAKRDYEKHVQYYYRNLFHIPKKFAEAPGYRTPESVAASQVNQFLSGGGDRYKSKADVKWEDMIEAGNIISGSPATVRDRLKELIKTLRIGNLNANLNCGSMPHHLAVKNIELFTKEVLPYIKEMWDDQYPVVGWPEAATKKAAKPAAGMTV